MNSSELKTKNPKKSSIRFWGVIPLAATYFVQLKRYAKIVMIFRKTMEKRRNLRIKHTRRVAAARVAVVAGDGLAEMETLLFF